MKKVPAVYRGNNMTLKRYRLSQEVVTCDVNRDVSTAYTVWGPIVYYVPGVGGGFGGGGGIKF